MTASKLDRKAQFYRFTEIDDGYGTVEVWAALGSPIPAARTDISDGEKWRAGAVSATVTTRFQVRSTTFTRDLTPKDRIECEGETFEIVGIKQAPGRRLLIEITATRKTDQ
ncbi:head-tail adaptor protein [Pararhodobacter oceanensis]|uniref:head-tail adaptor protein n=1 Tax=Pararhodobacter oceanensis TaxID=2172121 RepID=UPI003A937987